MIYRTSMSTFERHRLSLVTFRVVIADTQNSVYPEDDDGQQ